METILCIATGGIGDQVLTLPAIRYLYATLSHSPIEIRLASAKWRAPLFKILVNLPLPITPLDPFKDLSTPPLPARYDWVIDFTESRWIRSAPSRIEATRRYFTFFPQPGRNRSHLVDPDDGRLPFRSNSLRWQRCLEMAYRATCQIKRERFSKKELFALRDPFRLAPIADPSVPTRKRIACWLGSDSGLRWRCAVTPGGYHPPYKRWPVNRFASVIRRLLNEEIDVYLLGSRNEIDLSLQLYRSLQRSSRTGSRKSQGSLFFLTGRLPLEDLPYLLREMDLHLTNDNGVEKIAGALELPQVCLYRGRRSQHLSFGSQDRVLFSGKEFDMTPITTGRVLKALGQILPGFAE